MTLTPAARRRTRRLQWALAINAGVIALQVVAGIAAHSIGLLADAGHNLTDVAALVVSIVAVRLATRPPTGRHSFGYHRATTLAAQLNGAAILVVTVVLVVEAARRFGDPGTVKGGLVAAAAAVGLVANLAAAKMLHEHTHDLNMRSALLHMLGDAAASAGVLVAGLVIAVRGSWSWLDPGISILIAVLIAWRALMLLRETTSVLLEGTPAGVDLADVHAALRAMPGVDDVHDLHAWSLSSDLHALSAHVVLRDAQTLEQAQAQAAQAKALLWERFSIGHATIELEQANCATADDLCVDLDRLSPPADDQDHGHEHGHGHAHGDHHARHGHASNDPDRRGTHRT